MYLFAIVYIRLLPSWFFNISVLFLICVCVCVCVWANIFLTAFAANVYNAMLRKHIWLEVGKILNKNQNSLWWNHLIVPNYSSDDRRNTCKISRGNIIVRRFLQDINSIRREIIEQIVLAFGLPKEPLIAIILFYHNTKAMLRLLDIDAYFFDIVTGILYH